MGAGNLSRPAGPPPPPQRPLRSASSPLPDGPARMTSVTASQPMPHAAPSGQPQLPAPPGRRGASGGALEPATASRLSFTIPFPSPLGPGRLVTSVRTEGWGFRHGPCGSAPFQRSLKSKMLPIACHHQPFTPRAGARTPGGRDTASFSPGAGGVAHGSPWFPLGRPGPTAGSGQGQDHGHCRWKGGHCRGQLVPALPPEPEEAVLACRGRALSGAVSMPLAAGPLPPSAPGPAPAVVPSLCKRHQPAELRGLSFPRPASVPGRRVPVGPAAS